MKDAGRIANGTPKKVSRNWSQTKVLVGKVGLARKPRTGRERGRKRAGMLLKAVEQSEVKSGYGATTPTGLVPRVVQCWWRNASGCCTGLWVLVDVPSSVRSIPKA
jgi:hypothetical protein